MKDGRAAVTRMMRIANREQADIIAVAAHTYTVAHAVGDWLAYGIAGRSQATVKKNTILARTHVLPAMGKRKLRELSAEDVDRWLARKAKTLSTSTVQNLHSILSRSVSRAQALDKGKRNVVLLCEIPQGQPGRPSRALPLAYAEALMNAAESRCCSAREPRNCEP
jgi:hypothetical protein